MKRLIIPTLFILFPLKLMAADIELLQANEWAVPKKASTLMQMPAIHKTMTQLSKQKETNLLIRYPGGDEGTLWANELRSWMVALGLSTKRIILVPGSSALDIIELEIKS